MKPARIIVLLIALVAGGIAALLAGRSGDAPAPAPAPVAKIDTVDVLVAKNDVAIGQVVGQQDLQWQAWPTAAANANFVRKTDKPNAIELLEGSIARSPFVVGEPIREAKLIKGGSGLMAAILPAGMRAVSTEVSPETGAGGFILPNDRVDVVLIRRDREAERKPNGDTHVAETILSNVRVLAIDQTVQEKDGQKVAVGRTATLELNAEQTETLVLARQLGTLSLALRSLADANRTSNGPVDESAKRSRGEINMVRFGISTTATTQR